MSLLFDARVEHILRTAVEGLPEDDRAQRMAWCRATGEHGVRATRTEDGVAFTWGGALLALVEPEALEGDAFYKPLTVTPMPPAPDDPGSLTTP